jgi:hypothetical protein
MVAAVNAPYVKQFENGVLVNPIEDAYVSKFRNRRSRRSKDGRHLNNRNTHQIVVIGKSKFRKSVQRIPVGFNPNTGKLVFRTVYHSILIP